MPAHSIILPSSAGPVVKINGICYEFVEHTIAQPSSGAPSTEGVFSTCVDCLTPRIPFFVGLAGTNTCPGCPAGVNPDAIVAENIELAKQAGVIGQAPPPGGPGVVHRLGAGVVGEGGALFGRLGDIALVIQRDDFHGQIAEHLAYLADFTGVASCQYYRMNLPHRLAFSAGCELGTSRA